MELAERLKAVRDDYTDYFSEVLKRLSEESEIAAELLIQIPDSEGRIVADLFRIDILAGTPEQPRGKEVNVDPLQLDSEEFSLESGLNVTISEFLWNGAEFHSKVFDLNIEPFAEWYHKWMDLADAKEADDSGLCQVIHSVTAPQLSDAEDEMFFAIDFGSAPVEAFMELLEILSKVGIDAVSVRTSLSSEEFAG